MSIGALCAWLTPGGFAPPGPPAEYFCQDEGGNR